VVKLGPNSNAGFAPCAKVGDCERAESARITFESHQEGSGATGRYQLHFKDGKDLNGAFYVQWCESRLFCRYACLQFAVPPSICHLAAQRGADKCGSFELELRGASLASSFRVCILIIASIQDLPVVFSP
jgi:hypothetical protein